jgi:adenylate cyclase
MVVEPHGERKHATVLFADIVDSTELIAGLDVETAVGRLQPVVAAMVQAVQRFGGTVLRTLGDGLKAAFGAWFRRDLMSVPASGNPGRK